MKRRLSILMCVLLTSMVSLAATHEYVDLGLPSGTLWATYNIGASAPEGYGSYFAWGETTTKSTYSWSNYKYASGTAASATYIGNFLPNNNKVTSIQGTQYDVAKAQWGSDWVMPSKDQIHELINNCSVSAKTINGVKGVQYKGPNGKTMFLPCGGYKYDSTHAGKGTEGYYWSGTGDVYDLDKSKAVALYNKSSSVTTAKNIQRRTGASVRAVRASGGSTEPEDTDPEEVDLGLSVNWATFNVGATSKEGYGTYFAWGETSKKSTYTWANYQHASGSSTTCKNIGSDISDTQYDAARKAWGDDWRMPTASEIDELRTKCTWTAATVNGVKGYTVKGPSGKTIFLPFAGCSYDGTTAGKGSYTYYWSSEVSEGATGAKAYALYPKSGTSTTKASIQRRTGAVIRPVKGEGVTIPPTPVELDGLELVDLGLSVKWANMNLEAESSEYAGDYYAWGETAKKSTYTWANYAYANGTQATAQNIGSDISGKLQYDAAYAWSMEYSDMYPFTLCLPTAEQWSELVSKCTWTSATKNGVKGYTVKGPSGKSIFLPLAGCSYEGKNYTDNSYYWTSSNDAGTVYKAKAAKLTASAKSVTTIQRRTGAAIRAVEYEALPLPPTPSGPNGPTIDVPADEVDLGLSVNWASYNVGATSKEDYGNYYAWGETDTKSSYTWANYQHASGSSTTCKNIGKSIMMTQYDAASELWGDDWRMPTEEEIDELRTKCTWVAATVSGVKGYTVKGPSGNSIFLPFAGCSYEGKDYGKGSYTYYWSSDVSEGATGAKAYALYPKSGTSTTKASIQRRTGAVIRPVKDSNKPSPWIGGVPSEGVDLGLSVEWAPFDLYAGEEGENGEYIAWGETQPKASYSWSTYIHSSGTASTVKNIGSNISGSADYDAATDIWGEDWRLPTETEIKELISKCTFTATTKNGIKGYNVKGPNGNTIFLPFSGCSYDGKDYGAGSYCYFWSGTVDPSNSQKAKVLYIKSGTSTTTTTIQRRTGAIIRPVKKLAAPPEAYAVLSSDRSTLTFYYDNQKSTRTGYYEIYTHLSEFNVFPDWMSHSEYITKVVFNSSFANARPTSTACWFGQLDKLTTITGIQYLNTSEVTEMQYMFWDCKQLKSLDVSKFVTSKVTNMSCMFFECNQLQSLDVSKFVTSNVTNMSGMFSCCYNLGSLNLSGFNTSKVKDMGTMFSHCRSLTSLNLNSFNTSNVTFMSQMFYDCQQLKYLYITSFNTSKVTNMSGMFKDCSSLSSLNVSSFNTSYVTDMSSMFQGCRSLKAIDISNFYTSNTKNVAFMFADCDKLEELDLSNFGWMCVTNSANMVSSCPSLKRLYLDWDFCLHRDRLSDNTFSGIGTASSPCKLYDFAQYFSLSESGKSYYTLLGGYFTTDYVNLNLPSGNLWAACDATCGSPKDKNYKMTWGAYTSYIPSSPIYYKGEYYYVGLPTPNDFGELMSCESPANFTKDGRNYISWNPLPHDGYLAFPFVKGETSCWYWSTTYPYDTSCAYVWVYTKGSGTSLYSKNKSQNTYYVRFVARKASSVNGAGFDIAETDGISDLPAADGLNANSDAVYTLQGVKVEGTLKPGVYVKNGRKFVVK